MGIGADVLEALSEVGSSLTVVKPDGNTHSGEFITYANNFDKISDFHRQNVFTAQLPYNTSAVQGDCLQTDGLTFLLMNKKPTTFQGEVAKFDCLLLQTNVVGEFRRKTQTEENMQKVVVWSPVFTDVPALHLENIRNPIMKIDSSMDAPTDDANLYVSLHDVRIGDRWYPDPEVDKSYSVMNIQKYVLDGMLFISLQADMRS